MAEAGRRASPVSVSAGAPGETQPSSARRGAARRPALWWGAVVPVTVFCILGEEVLRGGPVPRLDVAVRGWVVRAAVSPAGVAVTPAAHAAADAANWPVAGAVLVLAALVAGWRARSVRPLLAAAALAGAAWVVVPALKAAFGRPGPFTPPGAIVTVAGGGYFPSGHAVTAVVCFGGGWLLCGRAVRPWLRRLVAAAAGVGCALVGAALVWCGFHWSSDVLAGAALGLPLLWCWSRIGWSRGRDGTEPGG